MDQLLYIQSQPQPAHQLASPTSTFTIKTTSKYTVLPITSTPTSKSNIYIYHQNNQQIHCPAYKNVRVSKYALWFGLM